MNHRRPPAPFELDPATLRTKKPLELPPEDRVPSAPAAVKGSAAPEPPPQHKAARRWAARAFGLGILGVLVVQTWAYLDRLIETDPLFGWPLLVLTLVVTVSGGALLFRELREIHRLHRRAHLREQAQRLAASELHGEAPALVAAVAAELEDMPGLTRNLQSYEASVTDALDDGERLRLFERQVLAPIDRRAYRLALESARDIGLLTALSPLGLLDGVLVLWRTLLMIRAVARAYGMAPGTASSLALLRRCIRNAALAGLADVVTHAAVEHVGASLAAILSARAGSGAGNALLAARLGIEAIKATRPLPFVAEEAPTLRHVRKALLDRPATAPATDNGKLD